MFDRPEGPNVRDRARTLRSDRCLYVGQSPSVKTPINIDNVLVLEDGRIFLCEDASQYNRTYPNDALWVYEPAGGDRDRGQDGDRNRGHGNDVGHDEDNPGRGRAR